MTLEEQLIKLVEEHGYQHKGGPAFIPDNDNPSGVPTGEITCPNCDAGGYWASWWQKEKSRDVWLHWCDHCGYRQIEIEL